MSAGACQSNAERESENDRACLENVNTSTSFPFLLHGRARRERTLECALGPVAPRQSPKYIGYVGMLGTGSTGRGASGSDCAEERKRECGGDGGRKAPKQNDSHARTACDLSVEELFLARKTNDGQIISECHGCERERALIRTASSSDFKDSTLTQLHASSGWRQVAEGQVGRIVCRRFGQRIRTAIHNCVYGCAAEELRKLFAYFNYFVRVAAVCDLLGLHLEPQRTRRLCVSCLMFSIQSIHQGFA